jgi:hypothetical protein
MTAGIVSVYFQVLDEEISVRLTVISSLDLLVKPPTIISFVIINNWASALPQVTSAMQVSTVEAT